MSIAQVQEKDHAVNNAGSGVNTVTLAYTSNNTAGNMLIAETFLYPSVVTCTVTDSQGNSWTPMTGVQRGDDVGAYVQLFYVLDCKAGANTVTFSYSGAGGEFTSVIIAEFSGLTALDQTGGANGTTGTSFNSGNVTTTSAHELLLGYCIGTGSPIFTAGAGYTLSSSGSGLGVALEYQVVTSTGTYDATFSQASSAVWGCGIATFSGPALSAIPNALLMMGCGT